MRMKLNTDLFLTAATKLGQGNIFTSVCLSTGGEGCLPQCMLGCPPRADQAPPREQTPPRSRPPWEQTPPGADPPGSRTHPPGADTPPEQNPPPGSRLQYTVYERPVRILLECILVFYLNIATLKVLYPTIEQIDNLFPFSEDKNMGE